MRARKTRRVGLVTNSWYEAAISDRTLTCCIFSCCKGKQYFYDAKLCIFDGNHTHEHMHNFLKTYHENKHDLEVWKNFKEITRKMPLKNPPVKKSH